MTLPVVHLTGDARAQGEQHGRELQRRIAHNLDVYFERFACEVGLSRLEVLSWARRYAEAIEKQSPAYHAAMQGVADGAGFAFDEIVALNVRYEILYYQFGKNALAAAQAAGTKLEPDGCTAFVVLPEASANGHLLLGQNWDWIPDVQGAVLRTTDPDTGHETLGFTEAGIVGAKIGLSSAGVGLCINGMTTTADDWSRLSKPVHVRCWEILRAPDLDAAVRVITDEARACSTNFLVAQAPDRVADIEAAPNAVRLLSCEDGCLVHTNHFVDPDVLGIVEPPNERRVFSRHRLSRLAALLQAKRPLSVESIQDSLRDHEDHPFGVCRHENLEEPPELHYITVTSAVMDLDACTLHITDGPPCGAAFQTISPFGRANA
jgi:isopenicillin-N N-acyltransferase-like protein